MSITSVMSKASRMSRRSVPQPQGPSQVIIRDVLVDDLELIAEILTSGKNHLFGSSGRFKCHDEECFFWDYATHRIMVMEQFEANVQRAVAYAEFANFPKIAALSKDCWQQWIKHHYCVPFALNAENTLFFNFFVCSSIQTSNILHSVLHECFLRESKLRYIIAVEMPEDPKDEQHFHVLEKYANVFYPRDFQVMSCKNIQHLHVIFRETIVANLRCRFALPEDNDDCVEIIDKYRPDMREEYGDFYVAEELLHRTGEDNDKLIVMESANTTAGFIWLNNEVDVMFLATNFNLEDFGHLIRYNHRKPHKELHIPSTVRDKRAQTTLFSVAFVDERLESIDCMTILGSTTSVASRYLMHVKSNSGIITISKENFLTMATTMKKLQFAHELLSSVEYYVTIQRKQIHLKFNVSNTDHCDEEEDTRECEAAKNRHEIMAHSNAFQLKLYGLNESIDVRHSIQIVITAFNAYTDRDYCVLMLHSATEMNEYLYELLKYFVQIPPRPNCATTDSLYVTYRGAIFGDLSVHLMRPEDIHDVERILCSDHSAVYEITTVKGIIDDVLKGNNDTFIIVTIRNGKSLEESIIVGYAVVRRFLFMHLLNEHFYINYNFRLDESYGEILTLKLHPCFHHKWELIFREIARLTELWYFLYILPVRSASQPLTNDLWSHMQPVEPRPTKKIIYERYDQAEHDHNSLNYREDYVSVFYANLYPVKWFKNDETIVILGFTEMTKSFLRSLIFTWNSKIIQRKFMLNLCLPRMKVTVIAEPGVVEADYDKHFKCGFCNNQRICWINCQNSSSYIRDTTKRIDLRIWIDFVAGHVKSIDTKNSVVEMGDGCNIAYDKLLLFASTEFGPPHKVRLTELVFPSNYGHVNNRFDKILIFHKLRLLLGDNADARILIYGGHARSFEFINFLVTHGVRGSSITLVLPYFLSELIACDYINNPTQDFNTEPILLRMAEDLNVNVYDEYNFSHWKCYTDEDVINYVTFYRNITKERLDITCDFFVSYHKNFMSIEFAKVLKHSNITMGNGSIIVDNCYKTSAHNVYALGKYIEHKDDPNHQYIYVSPLEAAEKLLYILNLLDPQVQEEMVFDFKYSRPHYFQAQLPFNYYMANIIVPKRYLANHLPNSYNATLTTYNGDFCRIRLNENNIIEQIFCVVNKNICLDFLKYFCGKHETLLNNLRARWYLQQIDSFIEFFQEPWTELLTHDRYAEIHNEIIDIISPKAKSVMNLALERTYRKDMFRRYLNDLGITKEVHQSLLGFVRKHRREFKNEFALPEDFNVN